MSEQATSLESPSTAGLSAAVARPPPRSLRLHALAMRNLLRNRRRSMATLLALVFGALAVLLFGGYAQSIRLGLETNIVRTVGHLQIQHPDYLLFGAGDQQNYSVSEPDKIIAALQSDPYIAPRLNVASPFLTFNGIAGHFAAGLSKTVLVLGKVIEDESRMHQWNDYALPIAAPPTKLLGTPLDSVVVGTGVARILQLCDALSLSDCPRPTSTPPATTALQTPDDLQTLAATAMQGTPPVHDTQLELLAATASGAPNVAKLHLLAAERQGTRSIDDTYIGIHLPQAQRLVYGANAEPRASAVLLQLRHSADLEDVRNRVQVLLAQKFPQQPLAINDFKLLNPSFTQTVGMFDAIFGFISVLIAVIVMFTVGNTMNMAVVERTVEIGTLRAIGVRQSGIRRIFVLEGAILGSVGALIGLVSAMAGAVAIEWLGLTWLPPGYVQPMPLSIHLWGEWQLIAGTVVSLIIIASLSSYWPARRASQLEIVESLRHV
ncbi:MAG: FtsX-like permease family protein [Burkholderiaceae bacterium]|jgi:putative ABC transport system permease protein|nr:FtsX-like permease family protein [Burkholderiaceae bacterium]